MAEAPRYRFGPLERRGVLAGLRSSQLTVLILGGLSIVAGARSLPPGAAVALVALVAISVAFATFVPFGGRTIDEWLPVLAAWATDGVRGRRTFVSKAPGSGFTCGAAAQPHLAPVLSGVTILSHELPGSATSLGVLKDAKAGTFTALLAAQGRSFALLDGPEKARRLAAWAGILASLAREGGAVHRFQWIARTVPDPGDEIGNYLRDNLAVPIESFLARSYLEVVDEAGPVTQEHETLLALQIHAGRSARAIKAAGGGDHGACEVLRREVVSLATKLLGAEIAVEGVLTPRLVAAALRTGFDPGSRGVLARAAAHHPEREGTSLANAGPMATESMWSAYRADGAWHRTYWISEWPRIDADPDFLTPLLLRTEAMRTVSLTMEPINPLRAIKSVESSRTSAAADEELRNRAGFVTTERRSREHEALASHERDLSHGHAFYRFAGFITVSAPDRDQLERSCGEVEEAAGRSFLDVRVLKGQQEVAFTFTLPLCKGLR